MASRSCVHQCTRTFLVCMSMLSVLGHYTGGQSNHTGLDQDRHTCWEFASLHQDPAPCQCLHTVSPSVRMPAIETMHPDAAFPVPHPLACASACRSDRCTYNLHAQRLRAFEGMPAISVPSSLVHQTCKLCIGHKTSSFILKGLA